VESWKRAPTRLTRPAWCRDTTDERTGADQPGAVPATPEPLLSAPQAATPQPPCAMSDRLSRALRRWGAGAVVPAVGARDHG